jgi:ribosomal protein S18 acetylase RimI-like enzyme
MVDKRNRLYPSREYPISPHPNLSSVSGGAEIPSTDHNRLSSLTVRPGDAGDASAVVSIWNDCFVFSGTGGRRDLYTAHDYEQLITVGDLTVAERASVVEGTLTLLDPTRAKVSIALEGELEITRLAVAARARRQGIARLLLACAHRQAVRSGARALVLWTRLEQVEARELYSSLGFRRQVERRDFGGERLIYVMNLRRSRRTFAARRSRA